jgi:hypothetical protein
MRCCNAKTLFLFNFQSRQCGRGTNVLCAKSHRQGGVRHRDRARGRVNTITLLLTPFPWSWLKKVTGTLENIHECESVRQRVCVGEGTQSRRTGRETERQTDKYTDQIDREIRVTSAVLHSPSVHGRVTSAGCQTPVCQLGQFSWYHPLCCSSYAMPNNITLNTIHMTWHTHTQLHLGHTAQTLMSTPCIWMEKNNYKLWVWTGDKATSTHYIKQPQYSTPDLVSSQRSTCYWWRPLDVSYDIWGYSVRLCKLPRPFHYFETRGTCQRR